MTLTVHKKKLGGIVLGYSYIGSKARIADEIIKNIGKPDSPDARLIDAFSGTGIVASKAADIGWKIRINDMMLSATTISESRLLSKQDVPFDKLGGMKMRLKN